MPDIPADPERRQNPAGLAPGQAPPVIPPPLLSRGLAVTPASSRRSSAVPTGFIVLSAVLLVFIGGIIGITGYFRLGSETTALRRSLMNTVPGDWDKTVAVHLGWVTTSLIRAGSHLFSMPPEPRAAFDAIHGAEVGVYKLRHEPGPMDYQAVFTSADKAMKSQGWDRIVGVAQENTVVAVYFPHRRVSPRGVKCCVVVFEGRDLVVASVSGNLEPLLKLAESRIDMAEVRRHLSLGEKL